MAVELMIAHDVNHRLVGKMLLHPFDALATHMNVPRQNYHVGICLRRRVIAEFQMQVA